MLRQYHIVAVTGSAGAGTSTVERTIEQIFELVKRSGHPHAYA